MTYERKMKSYDLDLEFNRGRLTFYSEEKRLTGGRGMFCYFKCLEGINFSTEADWKILESEDDRFLAEGRLFFLPGTLEWKIRKLVQGGFDIFINLRLEDNIRIITAGTNIQIDPGYHGWSSGDWRAAFPGFAPFEQELWRGFPPRDYLSVTAPGSGLPDFRVTVNKNSPLKETRTLVMSPRSNCRTFDFIRFEGDNKPVEIAEGQYRFFSGTVRLKQENPEPFYYPRDLFSQGPVAKIMVVSKTDTDHTMHFIERFRKSIPKIWKDDRFQLPEVICILPAKQIAEARELENVHFEPEPSDVFTLKRKLTANYGKQSIDFFAQTTDRIDDRFGLRSNLLAAVLGVRYKMKYDRAGCNMFLANSPKTIIMRKLQRIESIMKRTLVKIVKIIQFLLVISVFPFLALWEFFKTRTRVRKG